jgi:DNA-binding PucR family transcriptional regulator
MDGHIVLLLPGDDAAAAARDAAAGLGRVLGGPVTAAGDLVVPAPATPALGTARNAVATGNGSAATSFPPGSGSVASTASLAAASLAASHARATQCLSAMIAVGREGQGATVAELGFVGVLLSAGDTRHRFISDTLGPVLEYDEARGSDLAATLDAWFAQGGHLGRAAAVLHLHPNTVGQRLSRIGTLLGPEWSEPGRALQIQLALQLRSLITGDKPSGKC